MGSDKRSVRDRVKSGFFFVCLLIVGFLIFGLAVMSLSALYSTSPSQHFLRFFAALLGVCLAAAVMFVTAHRWGGFIAGFFFVPGALRAFGAFVSGYDYSYPRQEMSRLESGLFVLYCVALIVFVWRFVGPRRRHIALSFIDRAALTAFALGFATQVIQPKSYAGLIGGIIALLIAWVIFRWQHRKKGRHHTAVPANTQP
jgi:hypothetical protein